MTAMYIYICMPTVRDKLMTVTQPLNGQPKVNELGNRRT